MLPCACSEIYPRWCQKCVKNKVAHEPQAYIYRALFFFSVTVMFLPNFDGFCDLLNRPTAIMESICFIQWAERKKKTNLPCTTWLFNDLCQFSHFLSHTRYFSFFCFFFSSLSYLCTVSPKSLSMCGSRKYPYPPPPTDGQWKFLGGGGAKR